MINWQARFDPSIRPGLDRIAELLNRLGNPERGLALVHIAGTNGKGSTAAMVARALETGGHRVGLTVSPDLGWLNDRLLLNGQPIDDVELQEVMATVEGAALQVSHPPTFFEAIVAAAFVAFRRWQVDVGVIEVGLGGRLDATNIISSPVLSVITPVHFDHMQQLGSTIEQIAAEKAGILKPHCPLVLSDQPFDAAEAVIMRRAEQLSLNVIRPRGQAGADARGVYYDDENGQRIRTRLLGSYQAVNLATAWTAVKALAKMGFIQDLQAAADHIAQTTWRGRFEIIERSPLVVIDGGHNLQAAEALAKTIQDEPWRKYAWHVLFAGLADKPAPDMVRVLSPYIRSLTLTQVSGDRALDPSALANEVGMLRAHVVRSQSEAYAQARALAARDASGGALLVTGSLQFLGELRRAKVIP